MAKQILKIILSLGAVALSLLLGLNAEKLFVRNLGLVTIPVPNREIEPYTVISEDMFTTTEFTGFIKDFDYAVSYSSLDGRMTTATLAAGLPVPIAFISQAAGFYMDDPKLEIVSVPVAPGQMIGGNIYPDQYVNLYIRQPAVSGMSGSFPADTATENRTETVRISNLKVSAVLDGNGNDIYASDSKISGKSRAEILVLAVRPDQTQTIVNAAAASAEEDSGISIWVTIASTK
ncbi:MAG: hypothetical protein IJI07_09220 [Flexilinea sp.]|nr:hypothetical protein [Flexilinea sp.]